MILHPVATGSYVSCPIRGRVISVHDHAMNIRQGNVWRLTSLVDRERDLTALSLLVSTKEFQSVLRRHKPGDAISLNVAGGESWSGTLPETPLSAEAAARLCGQRRAIARALAIHGRPEGLRDLVATPGREAREEVAPHAGAGGRAASTPFLQRAARVLRAETGQRGEGVRQALDLSGLVGLGVGFTPSGDDFITGALASGALVAPGNIVDTSGLEGRLTSTTIGGATLLGLALDGSFPFYLVQFVTALGGIVGGVGQSGMDDASTPAAGAVSQAVALAVKHGHTSGTDAVSGFLHALNSYCARQHLDD
jgi:hypothetical protein